MYEKLDISEEVKRLTEEAEKECKEIFDRIDENALKCSEKVLAAFQNNKVSTNDFFEVTGYNVRNTCTFTLFIWTFKIWRYNGISIRKTI